MAQNLESILCQLCVPESDIIKQATEQLKIAVKDPGLIPGLCVVLGSAEKPQVRQYAAVLLRKKLKSKKNWEQLDVAICNEIRRNILQVLLREPEKFIRKAICHLVAAIARHDLPSNKWPELFIFIEQHTRSDSASNREVGMMMLQILATAASEQLRPHFVSLLELCSVTLNDTSNPLVPFYTIQTLTEMVPLMGTDELKPFRSFIPKLAEVITNLVPVDEEQAVEAMDVFDEMLESEVAIIVPHIKLVLDFSMKIAANAELGDPLRVKALAFVMNLVRMKRKTVLKLKLINPLLNILFPIMFSHSENDDEDVYDENETQSPSTVAAQVLDTMAMNLPPEKFIPPLSRLIDPALQQVDPNQRAAAFMAMAVVCEGCADHIMNKLLKQWLQRVYKGLEDPAAIVRNVAMFAMGQFAENLQPAINKYSQELLPVLFQNLAKAQTDIEKNSRGMTKPYYALEMFLENLEDTEIVPHLPQVMEFLLSSVASSPSFRAKELAVSAISAAANSAKKEMVPYFPRILEQFKPFLEPTEDENRLKVQIQTLDTLGVLARTMEEHFKPIVGECMKIGLALLESASDPDLRRCIYGMFAAISTILKTEMEAYLDVVVPHVIASIKSTEGITAHLDEDSEVLNFLEEEEENLEEDDDGGDNGIAGFSVENAYMDEKEDSCRALGEIAVNSGLGFMKYMEDSVKAVQPLLEHPSAEIRKGAVVATSQFCIAVGLAAEETGDPDAITALHQLLQATLPVFFTMVRKDYDRQLAMTTLDELKSMIDKIKEPVLQGDGVVVEFLSVIKEVIGRQTKCQDLAEESHGGDEDDEQEAEYDSMLVESAGELLPSLAKVMGGETFSPYFLQFFQELKTKTKKSNSVADRSFAIGTIAETMEAMGEACQAHASVLYPLCSNMMTDEDEEVRSNAIYAVGVLCANASQACAPHYPEILKALSDVLHGESDGRVLDNICGTVCRMIMASIGSVPMHQVFPIVLKCLPLKEDHDEYKTVLQCITGLYHQGHPQVRENLSHVVRILAECSATGRLKGDSKSMMVALLTDISQKHHRVVENVLQDLATPVMEKVQAFIGSHV